MGRSARGLLELGATKLGARRAACRSGRPDGKRARGAEARGKGTEAMLRRAKGARADGTSVRPAAKCHPHGADDMSARQKTKVKPRTDFESGEASSKLRENGCGKREVC